VTGRSNASPVRPSCKVACVRVAVSPLALAMSSGYASLQHRADFFFGSTVEHRRRERHAVAQVGRHLEDLGVAQVVESLGLAARLVVQLVEELAQLGHLGLLLQHVTDALANALACPAQVHFQHLTHVHPRGHAQRVQHDVARGAVGHVGHVFDRVDLGDHTLVAVTAGHLVAWLQAALDGQYTLTIFSTPAGNSSPWVSFLRFSSNARSKLWRVCSSEFLIDSSWLAISSSAGRMSNQWYLLETGQ
jgi:hypothetical protein